MSSDPFVGGWEYLGSAGEQERGDAAVAEFLSHPPTSCWHCDAPAAVAAIWLGSGGAKYHTLIAPLCAAHVRGKRRNVFAWVVDGGWTTTEP